MSGYLVLTRTKDKLNDVGFDLGLEQTVSKSQKFKTSQTGREDYVAK